DVPAEVDQQPLGKGAHFDVALELLLLEGLRDRRLAGLEVERPLLGGVVGDGDDHVVAERRGTTGEVEVSQREGIERAGQDDGAHAVTVVRRGRIAQPRAMVTWCRPSSSMVPMVRVPLVPASSPVPEPGAIT